MSYYKWYSELTFAALILGERMSVMWARSVGAGFGSGCKLLNALLAQFQPYFSLHICLHWMCLLSKSKGAACLWLAYISCVYNLFHRFRVFHAYLMCVFQPGATPSSEGCVIQVWYVVLLNRIDHHSWFGNYYSFWSFMCLSCFFL